MPREWFLALALGAVLGATGGPTVRTVRNAADPAVRRVNDVVSVDGATFTGALEERFPSGAIRTFTPYVVGRRDGLALAWYPNGRLEHETEFSDGRENGTSTGWWGDGRTHFRYRFRSGLLQGEAREWFPDGTLFRDFHYEDGHESGLQRMWYPAGAPRASYVVANGRRYGLPGTKGCTGTTSSPRDPVR